MSRERERFEEDDEIVKRIKTDRSIDVVSSYIQQQSYHNQLIHMGRRHMLGPGLGQSPPPPPGSSLNTITPCAACKLLRRRCAEECPFSPYFSPHEPQKFAAVHKVFGASNVSKMLMEVAEGQRADAANSLVYEANVRLRDPIYGCMGAISTLQQQVQTLQAELNAVRAEILKYKYREAANTLVISAAAAAAAASATANNSAATAPVVAAALPQAQLQSSSPRTATQQQPAPPQPPATPPHNSASAVVVSSTPTAAASLYTPAPTPPHSNSPTTTPFASISADHHSVPFFD